MGPKKYVQRQKIPLFFGQKYTEYNEKGIGKKGIGATPPFHSLDKSI
jgi:hypothetical protein